MLSQILISTLQILSSLYLTLVLLRFLLQLAKADFYNPICQFVVKATNPLLIPLRKVIPGWGGIDIAAVALALIVQCLVYLMIIFATPSAMPGILTLLAWSAVTVLGLVVKIYFWSLIAVIILSWISPGAPHPAAQLLHQITEPVMKPFRKIIPAIGGLDLSPIFVFILLNAITMVITQLSYSVGLGVSF